MSLCQTCGFTLDGPLHAQVYSCTVRPRYLVEKVGREFKVTDRERILPGYRTARAQFVTYTFDSAAFGRFLDSLPDHRYTIEGAF